ncbi:MAG: hypothetical protein IIB33_06660 [Chloroflexi bacterium]|nr:hypothetical protein [Chloroflexota bacterium]
MEPVILSVTEPVASSSSGKFQLRSVANAAGCVSVDDLMAPGNADLIQFDPKTGEVHGVDMFVNQAKTEKAYLFQQAPTPVINPVRPAGPAIVKGPQPVAATTREGAYAAVREFAASQRK